MEVPPLLSIIAVETTNMLTSICYLAVTSKIYSLQPLEGLLKLEKVDFKKNEVVIQSDSHKENE